MRFLVAPTSFKGSLTAREAAEAIARGLRTGAPQAAIQLSPIADGGLGTLDALLAASSGTAIAISTRDPLLRPITAHYGFFPDGIPPVAQRDEAPGNGDLRSAPSPTRPETVLIEAAAASGLHLLSADERDPLSASTLGSGRLIRAALSHNPRRMYVGLGDTATVDGGVGMLQALGMGVVDARGQAIKPGGANVGDIVAIDIATLDPRLKATEIVGLCDVESPLTGSRGARLYMAQKGATNEMCDQLERSLTRFADVVEAAIGHELRSRPGAGAAGGLGAAILLAGGKLVSGADFVFRALGMDALVASCDAVIGGEGSLDAQTLEGKATFALARLAQRHAKPLHLIAGRVIGDARLFENIGITSARALSADADPSAMHDAPKRLETAAFELASRLRAHF